MSTDEFVSAPANVVATIRLPIALDALNELRLVIQDQHDAVYVREDDDFLVFYTEDDQ